MNPRPSSANAARRWNLSQNLLRPGHDELVVAATGLHARELLGRLAQGPACPDRADASPPRLDRALDGSRWDRQGSLGGFLVPASRFLATPCVNECRLAIGRQGPPTRPFDEMATGPGWLVPTWWAGHSSPRQACQARTEPPADPWRWPTGDFPSWEPAPELGWNPGSGHLPWAQRLRPHGTSRSLFMFHGPTLPGDSDPGEPF